MIHPVFRTILVGHNGTPEAEHAVETAFSLAASLKARLVVLGILTPPSAESQAEGYGLDGAVKAREVLAEKFSHWQHLAQEHGLTLVSEVIDGDPEETIERPAEQEDADLIVVGHRQINRLKRWVEGSTSETLVNKSKVSVLVVRDGL